MAPQASADRAPVVLCVYAPNEEAQVQKLEQHLAPLLRQGRLVLRHQGQIVGGKNRAEVLKAWQAQASVILLLVSSAFLADDACDEQTQQAMQGKAKVIPVLLSPCHWSDTVFAGLQCLPRNQQPIILWDNQDKAWQEIVEGLRQALNASPSGSSASLPSSGPAIWNVPFARNPFFTGRDELLTQLHTQLQTTQTAAVSQPQAISGLGGIGKTALAVQYAYKYGDEYQAVLWAKAESTETLNASYSEIAMLLNLPQRDEQKQEVIVQAVKGWLGSNGGWLLILDNADELTIVPPFLPPRFTGHLLLTTRAQATGKLADRFEVQTMSDDVGALLLLRRARLIGRDASLSDASSADRAVASQITKELGGLPLALDQAGAYIEETSCGLAGYQRLYQIRRSELLKARGGINDDHPEPVGVTWSLSFEQVEARNPAAADLLRFCAFLAPDAIPEEILSKGAEELGDPLASVAADPFLLNGAIESLRAYSLLNRYPKTRTLLVHRLVQDVVYDSLPGERQQHWMLRVVQAVAVAYPESLDFTNWPLLERLLPHALICATWIEQAAIVTLEAALLLNQTGYYLRDRARYSEAEQLLQRALAICEQELGADHPHMAICLNNLAELYREQGKYKQAEPLLVCAIAIDERAHGPDHPEVATSLNNLALIYRAQGEYSQAEPLYVRALSICEQHLGPQHPNTATSLNNLAELYIVQGKYSQAELLLLRVLTVREQRLGAWHPDTARSLNNLALLYSDQGRYAKAEPLYLRALSIAEQQLGVNHPQTAGSLNNLGGLYNEQGRYAEAEPLYLRAYAIFEQSLGPKHPDTRTVRSNYARLLRVTGHESKAEALEREGNSSDGTV